MNNIEEKIREAQYNYYNGTPIMSDEEYDALIDRLQEVDSENPLINDIGQDNSESFKKEKHIIMMGSQKKATKIEELVKWMDKVDGDIISTFKMDGISVELIYENGIFKKAITRGDGVIGDDITKNALKMNFPKEIEDITFSGSIRGEILLSRETKDKYFKDLKNCRNAASGIAKRLDGKFSQYLDIVCYEVYPYFETQLEALSFLKRNNFTVVSYDTYPKIKDKDKKHIAELIINELNKTFGLFDSLVYDIDGFVLKQNIIDKSDLMENKYPKTQIAIKPEKNIKITKLVDIEWSNINGTFTPIGIVEPIEILGAKITRVSLSNPSLVEDLGLKINDDVYVYRAGMIIPKIYSNLDKGKFKDERVSVISTMPKTCPYCGNKLKLTDGDKRLYCDNFNCKSRLVGKIYNWAKVLKIEDFSTLTIEKLFNKGYIENIDDIYKITVEQMVSTERIGEVLAKKLYNNIHSKKDVDIVKFLAGINLEGVKEKTLEKIIKNNNIKNFNSLFNLKESDFLQYGIGEKVAENIYKQLALNKDLILRLSNIINVNFCSQKNNVKQTLEGLSFCFTGKTIYSRKEMEKIVTDNGGKVSAVNKNLNYLVSDDDSSTSSKMKKAKELGIKIINSNEFLSLI